MVFGLKIFGSRLRAIELGHPSIGSLHRLTSSLSSNARHPPTESPAELILVPPKSPITASAVSSMSFERLPPEIREMIYKFCLCVEGTVIPYPDDLDRLDKRCLPAVALLAVSRSIREEALPVLFGMNTWRINGEIEEPADLTDDDEYDEDKCDLLWKRYGSRIKHIELIYSFRSVEVPDYYGAFVEAHQQSHLNRTERADLVHSDILDALNIYWEDMKAKMGYCTSIKSIKIDILELFCPFGCCRKDIVRDVFRNYIMTVAPNININVEGVVNSDEVGFLIWWMTRSLKGKARDEAMARLKGVLLPRFKDGMVMY